MSETDIDDPISETDSELEDDGWSLDLSGNIDSSAGKASINPADLFRGNAWKMDMPFRMKGNQAFWNYLSLYVKNKDSFFDFKFSLTERLYFDYGIWCGEQMAKVDDVIHLIESNPASEPKYIYECVFEEMASILTPLIPKSKRVSTITHWLKKRNDTYKLIADSESYSISSDLLRLLPETYLSYFKLREKRIEQTQKLLPYLEKTPGMHKSIRKILTEGTLHDEIEFCRAAPIKKPDLQLKLNKLSKIWESVCQNLQSIFNQEIIVGQTIAEINNISSELLLSSRENQIDIIKIRDKAKELYSEKKQSKKRILTDISLLKNNLNVGAMKSVKKTHFPLHIQWPKPISEDELICWIDKAESLDGHYPHNSTFLLSPGEFDGFYEFDRQSLIIPIYDDGKILDHIVSALVDYRLIIEGMKDQSEFTEQLKTIYPDESPRQSLNRIYKIWLQEGHHGYGVSLNDTDLNFILSNIASAPKTLFLQYSDFYMDAHTRKSFLESINEGGPNAHKMHKVAGQYYYTNRHEEACKWLDKCLEMEPERPIYEISKAFVLIKLGKREEARDLILKWDEQKDYGHFRFFVSPIAEKFRESS